MWDSQAIKQLIQAILPENPNNNNNNINNSNKRNYRLLCMAIKKMSAKEAAKINWEQREVHSCGEIYTQALILLIDGELLDRIGKKVNHNTENNSQ
jgi:hypothetical protein